MSAAKRGKTKMLALTRTVFSAFDYHPDCRSWTRSAAWPTRSGG